MGMLPTAVHHSASPQPTLQNCPSRGLQMVLLPVMWGETGLWAQVDPRTGGRWLLWFHRRGGAWLGAASLQRNEVGLS